MKLTGKPISSPGRADKYPPPFMMRFLRTNVGSRSRGRSRTSPLFLRKRNVPAAPQEPSSPKVTCMGQVRANPAASTTKKQRCSWIRRPLHLCCHCHHQKSNPNPNPNPPPKSSSPWRRRRRRRRSKWVVVFFHCGFRKVSEDSSGQLRTGFQYSGHGNGGGGEEEEAAGGKVCVSSSWSRSPPKNALLLTRCRSAPYRSSSLAYRFWGSPLEVEERPTSEAEPVCRDSDREWREKSSSSLFKESVSVVSEKKEEELARLRSVSVSVRLTRCKSEPARSGPKLDPELTYWRRRRNTNTTLGDT